MDLEAAKIEELTGVSRNSMNYILKALRKRLTEYCEVSRPFLASLRWMKHTYIYA
jgi:homoserine dehydrogenase